ncbi:sugar transferase [Collinsella stercoris]|uniref:sugar transferase n=1 Tax=Collinsella stercoris TaxID=147206 RepID=UPI002EB37AF7|nr:sugar transferase [Collinsella stercoris]
MNRENVDEVQSEYLETTSGAVDVILPDESVAELGERGVAGGLGYRFVKRAFDIAFSALVIAVLVIPVAILCLVIVIDSPGAPFFRQERIGKGGRPIRIWKLRTMVADAHENPGRYMTGEQLETWMREQKLDDDPRVTRVGRLLRRTSLDELPQFVNVLVGDLSVIGPRPVTLEETYEFGDERGELLSVRPGITGWWQATERNAATWANGRRQELELYYVRHASLALDARVFALTLRAMFVERTGV